MRRTRRHWFGGSLIPKNPQFEAEIAPLRPVFGDGVALAFSEDRPAWPALEPEALGERDRAIAEERAITCAGACREVALVVENVTGHRMPSGDPERHVDLELTAHAADGRPLARVWYRLGSRYSWWPSIVLEADTRLAPGETRALRLQIPDGAAYVTATGAKCRMYEEAFAHHALDKSSVRGRVFFEQRWTLSGE